MSLKKELEHEIRVNGRRLGKTTALALSNIAWLLQNPNQKLKVKDHFYSRFADQMLIGVMWDIISKLELKGFIHNKSDNTFLYDKEVYIQEVLKDL